MARKNNNHLSRRGMTTTELKAEISGILEPGEEYTAREISEIIHGRGKDVNIHRVANTIKDMLGVDRRVVHSPVKGCRLYYIYSRANLVNMV